MINTIKGFIQNNSSLLSFLRFVPFRFRLGKDYSNHIDIQKKYQLMSDKEKEQYHFKKIKKLIEFAYNNNEFYRWHYDKNNFHPSHFSKLKDLSLVPIVSKSDLKSFPFEKRSCSSKSPFRVNTGGTSGQPLDFYLDKTAFAREWAYMHTIWAKLGYSFLDLKLSFRGKSNNGKALKYNVIHNEYVVDAYVSYEKVVQEIRKLRKNKKIKFIHGYPSSIYEFCKYLKNNNIDVSELFGGCLKGVFFGSEYPASQYRKLIESVLGVETVSWYGHSEMTILAYEKNEKYQYVPFQTYGFTEALKISDKESRLIGTSYYNYNSPFIRYDTGDLVAETQFDNGILSSFKVASGRIGDVVYDASGNSISLTALIFGRHHKAFDVVDFVQVKQRSHGFATLYVTSTSTISMSLFDLSNVDIVFDLVIVNEPVKTNAGKVPLLIT